MRDDPLLVCAARSSLGSSRKQAAGVLAGSTTSESLRAHAQQQVATSTLEDDERAERMALTLVLIQLQFPQ